MTLLEQAEAPLAARDIPAALAAVDAHEPHCAEPDRLSGGRWMCHMLAGDYEQAHRESDAIRGRSAPDPHRFWTGEPVDGKRVMLRCLHGYGDTVMYLRWLPLLRQRAREVTVQAAPEMLPLLGRMPEAGRLVTWNREGESDQHLWDVQIECAELPYLFRTTVGTLPPPTRFIFPETEQHRIRGLLRPRTNVCKGPLVGLIWTGSGYDPARSIDFDLLRRLLADHDVEFWSLQAPENNAEWNGYTRQHGWSARTFYSADGSHAGIADMAAMAAELDLIITIDTLAAHLAGSLGLPTWLLLKRDADWRWMLDRDSSPWYPTMRLFRQMEPGNWSTVLTQVCDRLRDWCEEQEQKA